MNILAISDEECPALWDYYTPGKLSEYNLILSCGDLKPEYLSFLVTMARCPVLYVHGNHDERYKNRPPEGCDCIEDRLVVYNGIRILGLGGSLRYRPGPHQYSETEMWLRIARLKGILRRNGGVDIVVTHAPPRGIGDGEDPAHRGFQALRELLDEYKPQYLLHGHIHLRYNEDKTRVREYEDTQVINVSERYTLRLPNREVDPKNRNQLIWKNKPSWLTATLQAWHE